MTHRLYGPLVEQQGRQAVALERLELAVRRIDGRLDRRQKVLRRRVPAAAADLVPRARVRAVSPDPSLPPGPILDLETCPLCGHFESTHVCEYNKLLLLEAALDEAARVYNYSLCHGCGVVSARRRPTGARYRYLFDRFEVALGRVSDGEAAVMGNAARTSFHLDEQARADLRRRLAHGVFVSELARLRRDSYLPALASDRLANSAHVELLGSLLPLKAPRVLELRPRLGGIGAALKRLYGADVYAMPLFEAQQLVIAEAYRIPTDHRLDFDRFAIPYEGAFDLIVANHMLTHAVHPSAFLATLRQRLAPGGHLYLYNESDEAGVLTSGKLLFNDLNAFHFQVFTTDGLARALQASGFVPQFVSHHDGRLLALASAADEPPAWKPMKAGERHKRVTAYQHARDLAILRLPAALRPRFEHEWDAVVERAVVAGSADFDPKGELRLAKPAAKS